jgi:hypothetical protein
MVLIILGVAGGYATGNYPTPGPMMLQVNVGGQGAAQFVAKSLKLKRVGLMGVEGDFGQGGMKVAAEVLKQLGVEAVGQEVYRAADRAHRASGSLTVVSVDKPTMRPRPIPDEVRAKLVPYAG